LKSRLSKLLFSVQKYDAFIQHFSPKKTFATENLEIPPEKKTKKFQIENVQIENNVNMSSLSAISIKHLMNKMYLHLF
jgi:hypothetical protein